MIEKEIIVERVIEMARAAMELPGEDINPGQTLGPDLGFSELKLLDFELYIEDIFCGAVRLAGFGGTLDMTVQQYIDEVERQLKASG